MTKRLWFVGKPPPGVAGRAGDQLTHAGAGLRPPRKGRQKMKRVKKIDRIITAAPLGRAYRAACMVAGGVKTFAVDYSGNVTGWRPAVVDRCPRCGRYNIRMIENNTFFYAPCNCGEARWESR